MPVPNLPFTFAPNTDIKSSEVNADLEELASILDPADAGLDGLNFAPGSPGQIWVCDSGGVPRLVTLSGDGSLSPTGGFTIPDQTIDNAKMDLTLPAVTQSTASINILTGWTDLVTLTTPPAGTYLAFASIAWYWTPAGTNILEAKFSDDPETLAAATVVDTGPNIGALALHKEVALNGSTDFKLQAFKDTASANANDLQSIGTAHGSRHIHGITHMELLPVA